MVDPKLFNAMKPEQAVRAAIALVIYNGLIQRPTASQSGTYEITTAFELADAFLKHALKP